MFYSLFYLVCSRSICCFIIVPRSYQKNRSQLLKFYPETIIPGLFAWAGVHGNVISKLATRTIFVSIASKTKTFHAKAFHSTSAPFLGFSFVDVAYGSSFPRPSFCPICVFKFYFVFFNIGPFIFLVRFHS